MAININNANITNSPFSNKKKERRKGQKGFREYFEDINQENAEQLSSLDRLEQQRKMERKLKQEELDKVFNATNNPESKTYTQEQINNAQKQADLKAERKANKKGKQTKKSRAREAQEKATRIKDQRVVDKAHGEALHENSIRDIDDMLNKYKNNPGPDFDSFNYKTDDSAYKTEWSDVRRDNPKSTLNAKANLSPDDAEDALEFIMSDDTELNKFFNREIESGSTYDEIRAKINKGRHDDVLNDEQFKSAKKMLNQNEDYIKGMVKKSTKNSTKQATEEAAEQVLKETVSEGTEELGNTHLKKALSGRNLNALFNLGLSVVDYKDARASGDGVIKAGAKAGAQFVAGEALGMWMMPVALAKAVPSLAIKGIETTQSITRNMNSTSRIQTFGQAEFHDTPQLATMRQAGMELAKMSQYNLQQSIMGNEAQYMHKL